jgi:hypothetical protein
MKVDSRKVAKAMVSKFIAQADELLKKPKLTAGDLRDLRRLRELAGLVKTLGV